MSSNLSDSYAELEHASLDALVDYVKGGGDDSQHAVARMALNALGMVQRRRTVDLSRDRLVFNMARSVALSPEELAEIITASQPEAFARLTIPARAAERGSPQPSEATRRHAVRS